MKPEIEKMIGQIRNAIYDKSIYLPDGTTAHAYVDCHALKNYRIRETDGEKSNMDSAMICSLLQDYLSKSDVYDKTFEAEDGQTIQLKGKRQVIWMSQMWNTTVNRLDIVVKSYFNADVNRYADVYSRSEDLVIIID